MGGLTGPTTFIKSIASYSSIDDLTFLDLKQKTSYEESNTNYFLNLRIVCTALWIGFIRTPSPFLSYKIFSFL